MQEIAQRLKSLRESVNLSQAKLAALMGATQASVIRKRAIFPAAKDFTVVC